jgi:hypothetical protein
MSSFDSTTGGGVRTTENTKNNIMFIEEEAVLIDLTGESDNNQSLKAGMYGTCTTEVISISDSETESLEEVVKKPVIVTEDELVAILEKYSLTSDPREGRMDPSSKFVKAYLIKNEPEFVRVMEFRDRVCYP